MVSSRLKQVIFKKLYMDLKGVEIIPYSNSIYFIDREKKYWYFEYEKNGELWWRYGFFSKFFRLFSLESNDYSIIMGEWVEEVLNCRVSSTGELVRQSDLTVEEVLNCRVSSTKMVTFRNWHRVEEVLNCRVSSTKPAPVNHWFKVEEVLNCRVSLKNGLGTDGKEIVEEVLNCRVSST